MNSSYLKRDLSYRTIFNTCCFLTKPKNIIEFGILEGYSLQAMLDTCPQARINAYDIFEEFNGNSASRSITEKFKNSKNVTISHGNFYHKWKDIDDQSVDIIHIDIANDGDTYRTAVEKYISKLTSKGIIILEGGSKERDEISWMVEYDKKKIQPELTLLANEYDLSVMTLGIMPSITVLRSMTS
jgi:hypothetical protein